MLNNDQYTNLLYSYNKVYFLTLQSIYNLLILFDWKEKKRELLDLFFS